MRFDRAKPYGEIRGMSGITGYMQGGREFDTQGNPVVADQPPPAPKSQKQPVPHAASSPQPPAEGEGQGDPVDPPTQGDQQQDVAQGDAGTDQDADQQAQPEDGDQPATDAPAGAVTAVHVGAGRWVVMSADKQRLTDTMSRDEVDAWIAANAPQPPAEGEGQA